MIGKPFDGQDTMTATASTPETTTWQLDPAHSSVGFAVKHLMIATVKGSFTGIDAFIVGDETDPASARLNVQIDAATITTANEQRDSHLNPGDFFHVEKFPAITFT